MEALDDLAVALRARLIERARAGETGADGLDAEVRELVEREAGALPEAERESLRERVLLLATGLGPLEPLLSDPAVDEVMVNGPEAVYVERRGRLERTGVSLRRRGGADARHRACAGPAGAEGGRGVAAVRRPTCGRLARERGDPAAVALGSLPDRPALPAAGLLAARAGGRRHAARRRWPSCSPCALRRGRRSS